jgi:hypothetical protein
VEADSVDLRRRHRANDNPLRAAEHGAVELLTLRLAALLRVVEACERPHPVVAQLRVVEQHAGHEQRPRQRSSPRLVGACDEARTELAIELKKLPAGATSHGREHSAGRSRHPKT